MMLRAGPRMLISAAFLSIVLAGAAAAQAPGAAPTCASESRMHALDFWIGEWDVFENGRLVGTNTISKVLDGCAIVEMWRSRGGSEGQSLFFRDPSLRRWKQVWVTQRALMAGGGYLAADLRWALPAAAAIARFLSM